MEKNLEISDAKSIKRYGRDVLSGAWSPGSIFYVDTAANGGLDTNNGSYDSPVLKVNYAMSLCTANKGDLILVRGNSPSSPNDTATIICDKAGVTIRGLYGRGILSDSGFGSPVDEAPCIEIKAHYVTIENLYLGHKSTTTGGVGIIENYSTASYFGTTIRNCLFDTQNSGFQYSIYFNNDQPYLLVEDCTFGRGDVAGNETACISMNGGTGAMLRRNIYRGYTGIGILLLASNHNTTILDEHFDLPSSTEGKAITILDGANANYISGCHANFGMTEMGANPYEDKNADSSNNWGDNYKGITATMPAS